MENPQSARGETLVRKNKTSIKRSFIQYETDLVQELNDKKSDKQSVSGRLLCLLYKRLSFWSRYAKHTHNGRRYFWKSISELSEELSYSEKQVSRGLRSLVELGLIIREKLNKKNWKHTYYYYLPKSVHTAEEASNSTQRATTDTSQSSRRNSAPMTHSSHREHSESNHRASGAGGARHQSHLTAVRHRNTISASAPPAEPLRPSRPSQKGKNVPFISREKQSILNIHIRQIVEKCLDYGENGIKPLTGRGIGFSY